MSTRNETINKGIKIPFRNTDELDKVDAYLDSTGRGWGPFVRVLLLNAVNSSQNNRDKDINFLKKAKRA